MLYQIARHCLTSIVVTVALTAASGQNARLLINVETPLEVSQLFCGSVVQPFANRILQSYSGDTRLGARTTLHELIPGSPELTSLSQNAVDPVHALAMFSAEDQEDLIWRALFWAQESTSDYNFGTANTDGDMAANMQVWENDYAANARIQRRLANNLTCTPFEWIWRRAIWCTIRARRASHHRSAARQYDRGVRFLQTADSRYKWIGGFPENQTITTTGNGGTCDCLVDGIQGQPCPVWESVGTTLSNQACYDLCNARYSPNGMPNTTMITIRFNTVSTQVVVVEVPNDGIVPLWSQCGWGVGEFETEGSNHFQVRNDKNTERLYVDVLEGTYTRFFNCE